MEGESENGLSEPSTSEVQAEELPRELAEKVDKLKQKCSGLNSLYEADPSALEYVKELASGYFPLEEASTYWSRPSAFLRESSEIERRMDRTLLIVYLKKKFGYESFLEIGCRTDSNFGRVPFVDKVGVDPVAGGNVRLTSDAFFATTTRSFDLVFIDGHHEATQAARDAANALRLLAPNGTLLVHDCKPLFESEAQYPMPAGCVYWNGTVWKAIAHLRTFVDVDVATSNLDWGIAVVRKRPNSNPIHLPNYLDLTWADYERNWVDYLNPLSLDDLDAWLNKPPDPEPPLGPRLLVPAYAAAPCWLPPPVPPLPPSPYFPGVLAPPCPLATLSFANAADLAPAASPSAATK
ncbi:hypothetical protein CTAYLR_010212 [Chrysophaeum taylorii]|uniref:Class I SAM-dependent methyltransferase n=1 Tax=Chrysophaeum taylorii TaxID=2483200 RepID=A0AAD7U9Y4_9STRA|nr:hypothetical protein CTAYLR_010212 [Chrysophaeum taylorii]